MAPELSGGCNGFSGGRSLRQSWKQRMSYSWCAPKCMHQSSTVQSIGDCTKVQVRTRGHHMHQSYRVHAMEEAPELQFLERCTCTMHRNGPVVHGSYHERGGLPIGSNDESIRQRTGFLRQGHRSYTVLNGFVSCDLYGKFGWLLGLYIPHTWLFRGCQSLLKLQLSCGSFFYALATTCA